MGGSGNKQYLQLADRPILAHTIALFDRHPSIDRIFVISPAEEIPFCRSEIIDRYGFAKVREVIAGGDERQDSVGNGLQACGAVADDIVLIHDGVRPFLSAAIIDETIRLAASVGGCVVGVPVIDTIKEVKAGRITDTPERRRLWRAQTPQAFPFEVIRVAHERARQDGFNGSDDSSLVERLGWPVAMLTGSYRNIKITTPEDLLLAELFHREGDV